jgi:hypothetical protein
MINNFTFYATPNTPKPAKGVPFADPVTGSPITRITDAAIDFVGTQVTGAYHGYVKHDIENSDGTKLIIQSWARSGWHIVSAVAPWNLIQDIVYDPSNTGYPLDCRWDKTDPDILYYEYGSKFFKYSVKANASTLIRDFALDFPTLLVTNISLEEEGTQSDDGRYWAFIVNSCADATHPTPNTNGDLWWQPAWFVYDLVNNVIVSKILMTTTPLGANFLCMSPSGKYVLDGAPPSNIYLASDFSLVKGPLQTHGHVCWAIDKTGQEVLVDIGHYYGPDGYVDSGYWVRMWDVTTGNQFWLAPWGPECLFHTSGLMRGKNGWAVVGSYNPNNWPAPPTLWSDASNMLVELVRTNPLPTATNFSARIWRLAQTHMAYPANGYIDGDFSKANTKGTKVWFGSSWGTPVENKGIYDVYQIDLPSTWYTDLG